MRTTTLFEGRKCCMYWVNGTHHIRLHQIIDILQFKILEICGSKQSRIADQHIDGSPRKRFLNHATYDSIVSNICYLQQQYYIIRSKHFTN